MRETILCITLAAVAAALFRLLVPESGFKKQAAFLVACFFSVSLINIITNNSIDVSNLSTALDEKGGYLDFTPEAYRMTQEETARRLSEKLREVLEEEKIMPEEISPIIDISGTYSISIIEVRLVFTPKTAGDAQRAEKLIRQEVGDDIRIVTEIKS